MILVFHVRHHLSPQLKSVFQWIQFPEIEHLSSDLSNWWLNERQVNGEICRSICHMNAMSAMLYMSYNKIYSTFWNTWFQICIITCSYRSITISDAQKTKNKKWILSNSSSYWIWLNPSNCQTVYGGNPLVTQRLSSYCISFFYTIANWVLLDSSCIKHRFVNRFTHRWNYQSNEQLTILVFRYFN